MKKLLAVVGLVAAFSLPASAALPVAENISLHFDASDASTLTVNDDGEVTEWRSIGSTRKATAPIAVPFPPANPFVFYNPLYVSSAAAEDGRAAVVFGKDKNGDKVDSLMDLTSAQDLWTVFVVSRQYDVRPTGAQALYGNQSVLSQSWGWNPCLMLAA